VEFKDLYNQVVAENLDKPVGFEFLREAIVAGTDIEAVNVWRLVYNPPKRQAHFKLFDDRTSAYNGAFLVADITYCADLEDDPAELFFALCKELMHVFDPQATWIDTREKFIQFLRDLQNTPVDGANGAIQSEYRARWMAILVLCPKPLRESIVVEINDVGALELEIAQRLGLPDWMIDVILDDYYDTALQILTS